jgi:hypothetical protein
MMGSFILLRFDDEYGNDVDVRLDAILGIAQIDDRPNIRRIDTIGRSYLVKETREEILDRMQQALTKAQEMGLLS